MKTIKFKAILWVAGLMACSLFQGCQEEPEISDISEISDNANGNDNGASNGNGNSNSTAVRQVDMTVITPVHPSSLKYFDYNICYTDNNGTEYRDTIQEGILPDAQGPYIYHKRTFQYRSLPVICRCEVEMVPKVSADLVVSFSYIVPKPYIYPRILFNSTRPSETETNDPEGIKVQRIDMSIGTFLSTYGSRFISTCSVKEDNPGISTTFY